MKNRCYQIHKFEIDKVTNAIYSYFVYSHSYKCPTFILFKVNAFKYYMCSESDRHKQKSRKRKNGAKFKATKRKKGKKINDAYAQSTHTFRLEAFVNGSINT